MKTPLIKWFNPTEKLPPTGKPLLAIDESGNVRNGYFTELGWRLHGHIYDYPIKWWAYFVLPEEEKESERMTATEILQREKEVLENRTVERAPGVRMP